MKERRITILNNPNSIKSIIYVNFDETPIYSIYFDMQSGITYDKKGVKEVTIKSTTGSK